MKSDEAAVAYSTLLTQLILRLQRDGVLSEDSVDCVFRASTQLHAAQMHMPTNEGALYLLEQMWIAVRETVIARVELNGMVYG
ncbi:MAG: hypothetical protein WDN44_14120 [Sphingomonas sp.]